MTEETHKTGQGKPEGEKKMKGMVFFFIKS